ncbi:hypothetical protein [Haloferula sp.]|uniref:hypothetical protein n=1 Tax=Haloferula sp. TaxID=2497595 RepID=UPI0032A0D8EE
MRETLVVVGLAVLALGLRSSRRQMPRKLGALGFLAAGFVLFYFLTDCWWCGVFGIIPWFLLPWVELLTRIRRMRLPMDNSLRHRKSPDSGFFPNASEAEDAMDEAGFEHVEDCGWEWAGMQQYFKLHWNPEERAEAAICLCEQEEVAFAFITVTSRDESGRIWRTTNYPFSPTLKCPPKIRWNHVPCDRNCFHRILADHREFLKKMKVNEEDLMIPDPEELEASIEAEMKSQIRHNLDTGVIEPSGEHHFKYSVRGLFFLWGQFVKDMVRLC